MNVAQRLFSILELYTSKSEWTVEEAAEKLGVSVSTAYRYFKNLCKAGFLDPFSNNSYVLGPAIIEYDRQMRMNDPLVTVGELVMKRLIVRSGAIGVALLCRIYRNCVMCVHQEGEISSRQLVSYERGRLMPMFRGASSKVIFANLPTRTARLLFEKSSAEIAQAGLGDEWESIRSKLREIRKAGVMVARGEVDPKRVGIASPVFGPKKKLLGSISVVISQAEAAPETVANISALVEAASREIHAGLLNIQSNKNSFTSPQTTDGALVNALN